MNKMNTKLKPVRWTPEEWQTVLDSGRMVSAENPNLSQPDRWSIAQEILPKKRRRSLYPDVLVKLDKQLRKSPVTAPVKEAAPATNGAHPEMILFRDAKGRTIGLDAKLTLKDLVEMGVLVVRLEPRNGGMLESAFTHFPPRFTTVTRN